MRIRDNFVALTLSTCSFNPIHEVDISIGAETLETLVLIAAAATELVKLFLQAHGFQLVLRRVGGQVFWKGAEADQVVLGVYGAFVAHFFLEVVDGLGQVAAVVVEIYVFARIHFIY